MTRAQIAAIIAGIGLPNAYNQFRDKPGEHPEGPPFICFLYPSRDDLMADNINYAKITELVIELYSDEVDFELEARVEAALDAAEIPYAMDRQAIESEKMIQTTYTTEVYLDA